MHSGKADELIVLVKGGGEVGTGVAHRLHRSHFRVCITEAPSPRAVCRGVAFSDAIFDGEKEVEGVVAKSIAQPQNVFAIWSEGKIAIIVDPEAKAKDYLHPHILIDAVMAKRNLGTKISDAPLVIGLGPGFHAGRDVHIVVETNYNRNLGRVILDGEAEADSGIPMAIDGLTHARVLHAPEEGFFSSDKGIGDEVSPGETVALVAGQPVKAEVGGVLRGLLRNGLQVNKGTKIGEIDPTRSKKSCYTIRPKMTVIAHGVLEAIALHYSSYHFPDDQEEVEILSRWWQEQEER